MAVLAGCGDAAESDPNAPEPKSLSLRTPAIVDEPGIVDSIRPRFRCDEDSVWVPLEWSRVPGNTAELAVTITVSRVRFGSGSARSDIASEFSNAWAIGGLDPGRTRLPVGDLPPGAFIAGGFHTECPPRSRRSVIQFAVHAAPRGGSIGRSDVVGAQTVESLHDSSLASGSVFAFYGGG